MLLRLRQAGGRGATLAQLGSRKIGDPRHRAVRALVGEGAIIIFGDGRDSVAVVANRAPTSESVSKKVEARAAMKRGHVVGRVEMATWCTAPECFLLDGAVRSLVSARRLVPLKHGDEMLYAHVDSFSAPRARTGAVEAAARPASDSRFRITEAYRRLVERDGFGDVVIAELLREAGIEKDELTALLLEESRCGRAHLGRGDWSLADESTRHAAVIVADEPHLRVRLVV